ncbi:MAG: GNAT family N-acetyltransferase [Parvularculaceae bacterium]
MTHKYSVRTVLRPGDLGRIVWLHGVAYEGETGHFGLGFEAYVARTIADWVLDSGAKGCVWLAEKDDALVGCAGMVARGDRGQLRWLLLAPEARGRGLGEKLVAAAVDYAADRGWSEVFLETTEGLDASMALYRRLGFSISEEKNEDIWGVKRKVITMVKRLASTKS